MFAQSPQAQRRPNHQSLAIVLAAIGVLCGAQPAAAQDQTNTSQRPLVPQSRQQPVPAVPVRPQQMQPNGANNVNNAAGANANAAKSLLNKLFPGAGGPSAPTQPGAAAPSPANTATGAATNPAAQLLQGLTRGSATSGNTRNPAPQPGVSASSPANPASGAATNPATQLLQGLTRGSGAPGNTRHAMPAAGDARNNAAATLGNSRNLAPASGNTRGLAATPANTRNAGAPLQMASLTDRQAGARAVQSRNFIGHPGPAGSTETQTRTGNIVRTAADGSVIDVHSPRNGMDIHHGLDGNRQVRVAHPDGSRVYASSRGMQYVQHPYVFRGRVFDHRTYYVQGQVFHQFYRPYTYGRTVLDVYATPRYYDASLYQWATSRFNAPEPFKWDYVSSSSAWYDHYKGYFTPDSSYSSPTSWLTDYVLASSLAASYKTDPRTPAPPSAGGAPIVTPEVKQLISDEVGRQVRQESIEAQQNAQNREPPPGAGSVVEQLADRQQHVFVVASDLDLVDVSGRRCMISEGDVVQVVSEPKPASGSADAVVLASKGGGECERAAPVEIALNDLQEMQNHMRETVDQGIATSKAAKKAASVTPAFVASAPPPDANAGRELDQQQQIAAAIEG